MTSSKSITFYTPDNSNGGFSYHNNPTEGLTGDLDDTVANIAASMNITVITQWCKVYCQCNY